MALSKHRFAVFRFLNTAGSGTIQCNRFLSSANSAFNTFRQSGKRHYHGGSSRRFGTMPTASMFGIGGGAAMALGWFGRGPDTEPKPTDAKTTAFNKAEFDIIKEADILYDAFIIPNLYKLLVRHADSTNAELLWRLARATCEMGKQVGISTSDRTKYMIEAFEYAKRALDFEPAHGNFAVHKWYAILLNYVSEIEGTKASLVNANEVRQHFEKACELNPNDPTSLHLLGLWHYTFADLPPYKRRLAAWVFASPPETTYEAALSLFEQAERVQPDFYSKNHLYIGKIYVHLQQLEKAKHHLTLAANAPVVSPDDMESHTEAQKMLKDLK